MKKFALLTMAATLLCSATIYYTQSQSSSTPQATVAHAEAQVYPESFENTLTFSNLSDFCVNGDTYAFAEETCLYILSPNNDDRTLTTYDCGYEIKRLQYDGDDLYLSDAEGKTYIYDNTTSAKEYTFSTTSQVNVGGYTYFIANDNLWWLYGGVMDSLGAGFSNLKECDGKAYTVKDNLLYLIGGTSLTPVSLKYTDFSAANTIAIGDAATQLKGNYTTTTVTVESGTYCTQIDLDETGGNYFKAIKTICLSGVKSALLLTSYGNASIIVMNDGDECKSYITLSSALTPTAYKSADCDITNAYTLTQTNLYSCPFISESTKTATLPQSAQLEVTAKCSITFMDLDYYLVSYTNDNGEKISGYVAANFLSQYSFASEQGEDQVIKGDFDYSTKVEKVILVLIIVGLVILAIAYLTIAGTKNSKKPKRTKGNKQTDVPRTITRPNKTYTEGELSPHSPYPTNTTNPTNSTYHTYPTNSTYPTYPTNSTSSTYHTNSTNSTTTTYPSDPYSLDEE